MILQGANFCYHFFQISGLSDPSRHLIGVVWEIISYETLVGFYVLTSPTFHVEIYDMGADMGQLMLHVFVQTVRTPSLPH